MTTDIMAIRCPFYDFKANLLKTISAHVLSKHLELIDTDYSPATTSWSYWNPKKIKK